jgi:CPA1 family monovalent cation:H+ antiporter
VNEVEVVLLLLVLVAVLTVLARRLSVPYPILMTLGGLVVSLIPGVPTVTLPPETIFLIFLPPILFSAAYFTSPHELKANARPIGLLAVGLVLVTTLAVGFVVNSLVPSIGWAAAFALGAIVSPPDAVSTIAIAQRLGLPRRIVTVLEGESLINDATALVAYGLAIGVVAGTIDFSVQGATVELVRVSVVGVAIGLVVGWAVVQAAKRLSDPPVAVLVSLLAPFAAWIPAELLDVSGVLSVVTAGIVLGRAAPRILTSDTRVLASGVWQMVIFVLNGLVFILIGLQLPTILSELRGTWTPAQLAILGAAVSLTVIAVRMIWVFPATYLPRLIVPGLKERDPSPPPQLVVILGWAGMRGVVSLAAALALPLDFPARDLLQFLTFVVILVTLLGQGLTLPWLIRRLGVGDDGSEQHDEIHAREAANSAALERLEGLAEEWPGHMELIDQLRARYQHTAEHLEHEHSDDEGEIPPDQEMIEHAAIRQAVIDAQRVAIIDMRDRRVIGDTAVRRVERDLDLEELRAEG